MRTLLVYVLALLLVGGLLFLAASFAFGRDEEMAPALPGGTPVELPDDRPATGADLRALRLAVVVRGYRMEEVDWVLDRLGEQVDARDREIARLRSVLHVEPLPAPDEDSERLAAPDAPLPAESVRASSDRAAPQPAAGSEPAASEPAGGYEPAVGYEPAGGREPAGGYEPAGGREPAGGYEPAGGREPAPGRSPERVEAPVRGDTPVRGGASAPGDGPVRVEPPARERRTGPGDPVHGLRPDGVADR